MNRTRITTILLIIVTVAAVITGIYIFHGTSGDHEVRLSRDRFPVCGIDISSHNGNIDFPKLAADSIDFVIIKATEGTSFKDSRFLHNYRQARRVGLKTGAYHFFRFDTDGMMQALNIINSIKYMPLDFPLMIDVEDWNNAKHIPAKDVVSRLDAMIAYLNRNGYNVILYSNKDGFNRYIKSHFDNLPLWICSFTDPPVAAQWVFWQYSHRGSIDGIKGNVDLNTFNGTRDQWLQWLVKHPSALQDAPIN